MCRGVLLVGLVLLVFVSFVWCLFWFWGECYWGAGGLPCGRFPGVGRRGIRGGRAKTAGGPHLVEHVGGVLVDDLAHVVRQVEGREGAGVFSSWLCGCCFGGRKGVVREASRTARTRTSAGPPRPPTTRLVALSLANDTKLTARARARPCTCRTGGGLWRARPVTCVCVCVCWGPAERERERATGG